VTEMGPEYLNAILKSIRRCPLTEEQVYRLWRCAIKDDEKLLDTLLEKVYDDMIAFDTERADTVMQLIIDATKSLDLHFERCSGISRMWRTVPNWRPRLDDGLQFYTSIAQL
jgi:hypothetical protein